MTRTGGPARRSGDPRRRAAADAPEPRSRSGVLLAALVAGAVLVTAALVALRPAEEEGDEEARGHVQAACDLTAKADEAAQGDDEARYAAAVFLLDRAIIESGRAAGVDPAFAELDRLVRAVHTTSHQGDPGPLDDAFESALAACRATLS